MDIEDFDYHLPPEAIAQVPVEPRDSARLLIDEGAGRPPRHGQVAELPTLLRPGDVVVLNTTRVLPARLRLRKPSGGAVEVLLLEPLDADESSWEALVRPSRKLPAGLRLQVDDELALEFGEDLGDGRRHVRVDPPGRLRAVLERRGEIPLPPYITSPLRDPERYQTVYAQRAGSVAAPTAGLHLTASLLAEVERAGAAIHHVELLVGLGTFRPITAARVEDHRMHAERYRVPPETMDACQRAERVVAVGTTTVRALESAAASSELAGRTDLFIHGERRFEVVDAMLTNFHQPRSSLLVLVEAFVGTRWRALYDEALAGGYRFLSFGDAMFLRGERG